MLLFADISTRLANSPELYSVVQFRHILIFFAFGKRYAQYLTLITPRRAAVSTPSLPTNLQDVLCRILSLPPALVQQLWDCLGGMLFEWTTPTLVVTEEAVDQAILPLVKVQDVAVEVCLPPQSVCTNVGCKDYSRPLGGDKKQYTSYLYTLRRGVLPVHVVTLYCHACHTTYRPNYFVTNASSKDAVRQYYGGMPSVIEAAQHFYFEPELISSIRAQMAFSHASADTVARVYNATHNITTESGGRGLTADVVWHAFYLHALLLDKQQRDERLHLPHAIDHSERFTTALKERNTRMVGTGQPEWSHACNECEKILDPKAPGLPSTRLSGCVMDGVTIGHTRCNVPRCVGALKSPRDRFCQEHEAYKNICAIKDCKRPNSDGMRTCDTPSHRSHEKKKRESGQALYRLTKRLLGHSVEASIRSARIFHLHDNLDILDEPEVADLVSREDDEDTEDPDCQDKTVKKLKSAICRRWTHNEQVMYHCCGIIVSRATFYEAESISNALWFYLTTYPYIYPRAQPSFCFFDNNCLLLKHIEHIKETRVLSALPVDVFHATVKHKDTDAFCAVNCNPASFPELVKDGKWLLNSSAAEQGNGWIGKFAPVVREMSEVHFNFYLDEMIKLYNGYKVTTLRAKGACPRYVPLEELRLPRQ